KRTDTAEWKTPEPSRASLGALRPAATPQHADTRLGLNPTNTRAHQRIQTEFRNAEL
ncbi:gamma-aminobutyric acid type B receptor subunit 2-like, partial [Clarias magur]